MPDTPLGAHAEALRLFGERVRAVGADQWRAPTPCTLWNVRQLVGHVTAEQLWVEPLVTDGRSAGELGDAFSGDVLGEDPAGAWDRASAAAHTALAAPGALERTVGLSYGPVPGSEYCAQLTVDCAVHAWDLSRAIGADERLPDDLVAFCAREVAPHAAELAASGMFAPPLQAPPGASAQTRLLALMGRLD
ncbi:TIGR03086 family metal-binding protein [Streptomyces sp. NPDC051567]|uniref:TIGR03086 family metal-binding protein n=1 Tax=Streptomyces sp. NPDC051567 TaxID=3365660 RepID=UPI00379DF511